MGSHWVLFCCTLRYYLLARSWPFTVETCSRNVTWFYIQGAYKLWEEFAKPYFYKYWTELHEVTTIWKRNVCSFIVTLSAFKTCLRKGLVGTESENMWRCTSVPPYTLYAQSNFAGAFIFHSYLINLKYLTLMGKINDWKSFACYSIPAPVQSFLNARLFYHFQSRVAHKSVNVLVRNVC